jgi:hypothetical protein
MVSARSPEAEGALDRTRNTICQSYHDLSPLEGSTAAMHAGVGRSIRCPEAAPRLGLQT